MGRPPLKERAALIRTTSPASLGSRLVADLRSRFDELLRRLGEIYDLQHAAFLLVWDQETKMPPLGSPGRAEQLATLARIRHELGTAPELGSLLEELRELEESCEPARSATRPGSRRGRRPTSRSSVRISSAGSSSSTRTSRASRRSTTRTTCCSTITSRACRPPTWRASSLA